MTPHTIPQTVLFPDLFAKPLVATLNQEHASSDGGAVVLKAAERVYGLVKAFARCLADKRAACKIRHTFADLIGQRVFGIACGHPDAHLQVILSIVQGGGLGALMEGLAALESTVNGEQLDLFESHAARGEFGQFQLGSAEIAENGDRSGYAPRAILFPDRREA